MLPPQVAQLDLCVPYQSTVPETPSGITETSTSHLLEPPAGLFSGFGVVCCILFFSVCFASGSGGFGDFCLFVWI